MPTIRISDKSWERLKAWAEPLTDTADSALAKALDAAEVYREAHGQEYSRPAPSSTSSLLDRRRLPKRAFREPLLEAIYELGGRTRLQDLRTVLKERMKSHFLPGDLEREGGGPEPWWNAACRARYQLHEEGYLRSGPERGIWALSEKGVALVESRLKKASGSVADHLRAMPVAGEDSDFDRSSS